MSRSREQAATTERPVNVAFIAGSSFSGSTLLGLILGADPRVMFVGELNQYRRAAWRTRPRVPGHLLCSCGEAYSRCPFWSGVFSRLPPGRDLNPSPGFSFRNLQPLLETLVPGPLRTGGDRSAEYGTLARKIRDMGELSSDATSWIVDSSKSLRALDDLAASEDVDVHVIHLIRDASAVAGSFKKRGRSAIYGMAAWAIVNIALRMYVSRRRLRCLVIDYGDLCEQQGGAFRRIQMFLGLDSALEDPVLAMRRRTYHLMGGNQGVRPAAGRLPFEGIGYRADEQRLNRLERLVAWGFLSPLQRLLLHGAPRGFPPHRL